MSEVGRERARPSPITHLCRVGRVGRDSFEANIYTVLP